LKEIDHLKEEIKNNASNQKLLFGLNIKLKTLETQYKESKGNTILGKLKEDEEQKEFEKFIIGKVNPDRGEEKNKVLGQVGDYLKLWYNKELQQINYAARKQKFIDLIAFQIKEDCSGQHRAYRADLRERFAVFDEVYAEALLDSVI
jgi:flagellin-like hook-associated protein FlgL